MFLSSTSTFRGRKKAKRNLEVKEANTLFHSKRKLFKHFKSELKGNNISLVFSQFQYCPETLTKEQYHAVAPYAEICNRLKKLIMLLLQFTKAISPKKYPRCPSGMFLSTTLVIINVGLLFFGFFCFSMVISCFTPLKCGWATAHECFRVTPQLQAHSDLWRLPLLAHRVPQRKSGRCYEPCQSKAGDVKMTGKGFFKLPKPPLHPEPRRDMELPVLLCRLLQNGLKRWFLKWLRVKEFHVCRQQLLSLLIESLPIQQTHSPLQLFLPIQHPLHSPPSLIYKTPSISAT